MLEIILPGIVMFVVFFILNMAFGFVKDKEGKKSLGLSLIFAFVAAVAGTAASWAVTTLF
jgi:hypothetical protein